MALRFREALDEIWNLVTLLNRAIDEQKPWDLYKHGRGVSSTRCSTTFAKVALAELAAVSFMPAEMTESGHSSASTERRSARGTTSWCGAGSPRER